MTVDELYDLHINQGKSCRELSRMLGRDDTYVSNLFIRSGLKARNAATANALVSEKRPKKMQKLNDELTCEIKLAQKDGTVMVFFIYPDGKRSSGVPASPVERALWKRLVMLEAQLDQH